MTAVTIWYDGACPLCIREIALMRRLDRRSAIAFVDVAPQDAACPIDRTLLLARFHAREGDGPILDGAAAFAYDRRRQVWLEAQGFCVVRFASVDVLKNFEGVAEGLVIVLARMKPRP